MKAIPIVIGMFGAIILLRAIHLASSLITKGVYAMSFNEHIELNAYGCIILSVTTALMVQYLVQRKHYKVKKRCRCHVRTQIRWGHPPEHGIARTDLWQCNQCDKVHEQEYGFRPQTRKPEN